MQPGSSFTSADLRAPHKTNVGGACVGAGLARDSITAVCQLHRGDAIAGKPAPTQASSHI
ncbi:hypothetical protein C1X27_12555 [Pseudomonas sp. MPR-AND1B]|nr:hypothetical protein C1X26_14065 [Pseudomonas sp. MPR-R3A]PMY97820.1 hypothetical protein C1X24_12740 [Pseudomonas sp. FW305-124]PMZ72704.1 hypothetical protein C1X25_10645 [Pseudomonas sp. GW247-3R2A]PNA91959.1 hypothetical protein C1X23_16075 [Pseudomonas sp. FW300-E2]PNB02614.1 hypothetical protein C1X27_12555 [Pseudomonas sp. MPR-AND1B]PRW68574.1 hypothetical protein C7A09_12970 [Pseudomonas fluorescens]